jgi:ribokinase
MSHILADLLGNDHPLFKFNLRQLEESIGSDNIDAKLVADMLEQSHAVMRQFGVDVQDTTAKELYYALQSSVQNGRARSMLRDTEYVLHRIDGEVVSLNLHDVIENAHHQLSFERRKLDHAKRKLRMEIIRRYAEHDRTDNKLVHQLTDQMGLKHDKDELYEPIDSALKSSDDKEAPSILFIGDIFTDAFIKLDENYARIDTDKDGSKRLSLPFGDKPPYERADIVRSVGPSPNSAISCVRLGVNASLMSWLGDDEPGRESLQHLRLEGVDSTQMFTEKGKKSSYWYVLRYGTDRTMLVKSEKYSYVWKAPQKKPDWIYLSYIGEDSWQLHEDLVQYLDENPEIKFVFQPGSYHFEWGVEKLAHLYKRSDLVIMNREEAMGVTGKSYESVKDLCDGLHELGPDTVVVTDGGHGSYASYGGKLYNMPNYPDVAPPTDRTGAGDAFASTITAALALGESIETALTWAPINSMNVVQHLGAQAGLQTLEQIKAWLAKAPEDYTPQEM